MVAREAAAIESTRERYFARVSVVVVRHCGATARVQVVVGWLQTRVAACLASMGTVA